MKVRVLRFASASLLFPLSACMNLSGLDGGSKYACQAPEGVACDSVSGTYANALHHKLPSQEARRPSAAGQEQSGEEAPQASGRTRLSAAGAAGPGTTPGSLRSQARILRLWIKPWEDADGDLYDQSYVYVQVDNGQWLIDHLRRQIREAYAPLRPPPPAAANAAAGSSDEGHPPATPQRAPFIRPGAGQAQ